MTELDHSIRPLAVYWFFFPLPTSSVVFGTKYCLSTNFNTSSMSLPPVSSMHRGEMARTTYMTGALMTSTAFHSAQFRGRIENSAWRTGVYSSAKCRAIDRPTA